MNRLVFKAYRAAAALLCLVVSWSAVVSGVFAQVKTDAEGKPAYPQEYHDSLKGGFKKGPGFRLIGPKAEQCVKFEPAGVRLTLPAGFPGPRPNTGFFTGIGVKGDFEITVRFEILHEPEPRDAGMQTRFTLTAHLNKSRLYQATLSRQVVQQVGPSYLTWVTRRPENAEIETDMNVLPSKARTGQLRLVRAGAVVAYYAVEGDGDFALLQKYPVGSEDLQDVRLVGITGDARAALDVRFTDLRIRAQALTNLPEEGPEPLAESPAKEKVEPTLDKAPPRKEYPQEYYHSFKGNPEKPAAITLFGPDAPQCVQFEPDGLRIRLPAGFAGVRRGNGVTVGVSAKGDFEITVGFEVLQEPAPADAGEATRLTVDVGLERKKNHVAALSRVTWEADTPHYRAHVSLPSDAGGNKPTQGRPFPARARTGRLRLVRNGAVVSYFVSEAGSNEFRLLQQYRLGATELENVRIVGRTGGPRAALDVRVTDFRIRADWLSETSRPAPAARENALAEASNPPSPSPEQVRKVPWSLIGAGSLLAVLPVAACLFLYFRRRARNQPETALVAAPREQPSRASSSISLECSGCGKQLKARRTLAGKKIQCPSCNRTVLIPGT